MIINTIWVAHFRQLGSFECWVTNMAVFGPLSSASPWFQARRTKLGSSTRHSLCRKPRQTPLGRGVKKPTGEQLGANPHPNLCPKIPPLGAQ